MNTKFEHILDAAAVQGEPKTTRNNQPNRYYKQFFDLESSPGRLIDGTQASEKPQTAQQQRTSRLLKGGTGRRKAWAEYALRQEGEDTTVRLIGSERKCKEGGLTPKAGLVHQIEMCGFEVDKLGDQVRSGTSDSASNLSHSRGVNTSYQSPQNYAKKNIRNFESEIRLSVKSLKFGYTQASSPCSPLATTRESNSNITNLYSSGTQILTSITPRMSHRTTQQSLAKLQQQSSQNFEDIIMEQKRLQDILSPRSALNMSRFFVNRKGTNRPASSKMLIQLSQAKQTLPHHHFQPPATDAVTALQSDRQTFPANSSSNLNQDQTLPLAIESTSLDHDRGQEAEQGIPQSETEVEEKEKEVKIITSLKRNPHEKPKKPWVNTFGIKYRCIKLQKQPRGQGYQTESKVKASTLKEVNEPLKPEGVAFGRRAANQEQNPFNRHLQEQKQANGLKAQVFVQNLETLCTTNQSDTFTSFNQGTFWEEGSPDSKTFQGSPAKSLRSKPGRHRRFLTEVKRDINENSPSNPQEIPQDKEGELSDTEEKSPAKLKLNHVRGFVDIDRQVPRDFAQETIYKGTLIGKPPHYQREEYHEDFTIPQRKKPLDFDTLAEKVELNYQNMLAKLQIEQKCLQKIHPARYPTVPELKLQHGLIKGYIGQVVGEAEAFIQDLIDEQQKDILMRRLR